VEKEVEEMESRGRGGVKVVKEDRMEGFAPGDFRSAWAGCRDGLWGNHDESGLLPELLG